MNEITKHDPKHYTMRALRLSTCWQLWCQQMFKIRTMATEARFHGDQFLEGSPSHFLLELQKEELKETFVRMMFQSGIDWAVSGVDLESSFDDHARDIWGPEIATSLRGWWNETFPPLLARRIELHEQGEQASKLWADAQKRSTPEGTEPEPR